MSIPARRAMKNGLRPRAAWRSRSASQSSGSASIAVRMAWSPPKPLPKAAVMSAAVYGANMREMGGALSMSSSPASTPLTFISCWSEHASRSRSSISCSSSPAAFLTYLAAALEGFGALASASSFRQQRRKCPTGNCSFTLPSGIDAKNCPTKSMACSRRRFRRTRRCISESPAWTASVRSARARARIFDRRTVNARATMRSAEGPRAAATGTCVDALRSSRVMPVGSRTVSLSAARRE
mmetsp:Transcript_38243/g.118185  ORF Transcript_38243/g.118185 Transcript_38243/m.118185 type:complete len:239 (+) Transcript_38243:1206-1922(+)